MKLLYLFLNKQQKAPIRYPSEVAGTVIKADHSFDGGYAGSDNVLVKVQGEKKNRFVCKTKYAGHFRDGQEVFVTIGGSRYKAAVKKVSSEKLYLYPKNASSLQHGAVGTVDLILKEKKDVLSLPLALVYDMGGKKVVYMEGKNGVKETREVTLGETMTQEPKQALETLEKFFQWDCEAKQSGL